MKRAYIRVIVIAVLTFAGAFAASAQSRSPEKSGNRGPAVVIVNSVAKGTWATTKFVVKEVAAPVAKFVFVKAAPKAGIFLLKRSPGIAKRVVPTAVKVALL